MGGSYMMQLRVGTRSTNLSVMTRGAAAMVVAAALLTPAPVAAQAVCSAPHSSPVITQSGSISTMPPGAGWLQISAVASRASESFAPFGGRVQFAGGAVFETRSAYLTGSYGVAEGVEIWGQLPLTRLEVAGPAGSSLSNGVGDIRTAVRVSPLVLGYEWPVAVRLGLKIPGSDFPVDATELPLSEGQRDIDLSVETGWTSLDYPVYVVGWVGYRWRAENTKVEYEPGDEVFAHAAVGAVLRGLPLELGVDALWGGDLVEQGITLPSGRRRLWQVLPTLGTEVGPGTLEVTAPISVAGRNLPVSYAVSVGYRVTFGMQ